MATRRTVPLPLEVTMANAHGDFDTEDLLTNSERSERAKETDDRIVRVREHLAALGYSRCSAFESIVRDLKKK
jgi:hypothetical protein